MESLVKYDSDEEISSNSKTSEPRGSREKEANRSRSRRSQDDTDASSRSEDERKSARRDSKRHRHKSRSRSRSPSRKRDRRSSSRSRHGKKKRRDSRDSRKKDRRSPRRDSRDRGERSRRDSRDRDDHSHSRRDRDRRRSRDRDERKKDRDRSSDRHKDKSEHRRRHDRRSRERSRDRPEKNREPAEPSSSSSTHHQPTDSPDDRNNGPPESATNTAQRKADALNRVIERRAQEKIQQLQRLGIEIPALMTQQQKQLEIQQKLQNSINNIMSANNAVNVGADNAPGHAAAENENLTMNLSNFTSSVLTNAKYTEQMQKKKMIWGAKKAPSEGEPIATNNKWEKARFSQDNDGKVASKFMRLMGLKNAPVATAATATATATGESTGVVAADEDTGVKQREQMFSSMEQQYEVARQATHTMRGMGLGFGSQSRPY